MPPTDAGLSDYSVSYGVPSLFMTAVFVIVLPLVYFKFARRRFARWPARAAVLAAVWSAAFAVAYADVLWIAWLTKRLCDTQAGLEIHRTVRVAGIGSSEELLHWFNRHSRLVQQYGANPPRGWSGTGSGDPAGGGPEFVYHVVSSRAAHRVEKQVESIRRADGGEVLVEFTGFRPLVGWMDEPLGALPGPRVPHCRGPGQPGRRGQPFGWRDLVLAACVHAPQP